MILIIYIDFVSFSDSSAIPGYLRLSCVVTYQTYPLMNVRNSRGHISKMLTVKKVIFNHTLFDACLGKNFCELHINVYILVLYRKGFFYDLLHVQCTVHYYMLEYIF